MQRIQRVLAIVAAEPTLREHLIESRGIDGFTALTGTIKFLETLGDHRQQIRPSGQLGHIVDGTDQLNRTLSPIRIAIQDAGQVVSNLRFIKREQRQHRRIGSVDILAMFTGQHRCFGWYVAKVVRAAGNNQPPCGFCIYFLRAFLGSGLVPCLGKRLP